MTNLYPIRPARLAGNDGDDPGPPGADGTAGASNQSEQHRGQFRFAERFKKQFGGRFLCAHGLGWHQWDSTRWAKCDDRAEDRAVHALIKAGLDELRHHEGRDRDELYKDIRKVESAGGVAGILALAKTMRPCTLAGAKLDGNGFVLNTPTGTVELETGEVRPARPTDHLSKVTRGAFDPNARADVFDRFLEQIQPDAEQRAFLARQLGYALLGVVREHALFIWTGEGANGKSTLRDAVLHALGDYAVEVPSELLIVTRFPGSKLDADRMALKGARVAFCSELARNARMDEAVTKKLTGGEQVDAKLLYENSVTFAPSHTLFMLTNHLPQVRGDDPAIWRRLIAVPFGVTIPEAERDPTLPEQLKACPDAVLAWLWAGWLDYQRVGLNPPEAARLATRKYQMDSDILARFLADEDAVVVGHGSARSAELFAHFTEWVRTQGEHLDMTQKGFSEALEKRGFTKAKSDGVMRWRGVLIVTDRDREA